MEMNTTHPHILIIGPSWVGDTVMAQSLFKLIKQQNPNAIIDVLAPAWTFSLLSKMPEVQQTIEIPITHGELKLFQRYQLAKLLRARNYTQAIVLPNSFKSALIPWLAHIPLRTGWRGEYRYGLLNDVRRLDKKKYPLMIEQYLALGLPANAPLPKNYPYPEFIVTQAAQAAVLAKHQPIWRGKPILALCAGAEFGPSKRWPAEYYAQIANTQLAAGWDVWLFGSQKDKVVTDEIMRLTQQACENLAGRLLLAETIELLSLVAGVISNDSGLMHVAAALKKPVIAIYGSTSPAFTPPLSEQAKILKLDLPCQPCFQRECPLQHHRCMRDLTPEQVLTAMKDWQLPEKQANIHPAEWQQMNSKPEKTNHDSSIPNEKITSRIIKRILIIKTSSMGDVVHMLPALTDAKKAFPHIQFDWVVEQSYADIPPWHPAVDRVIPISLRRWRKTLWSRQTWKEMRALRQQLSQQKYDAIIDTQGLLKSALLTYFTQGERIGLDYQSARESFASFAYQKKCNVNFLQHAIARMRQLMSAALNYPLPKTEPEFGIDRAQFPALSTTPKYMVFLHGTTWASKQWPEEYWITLAKMAAQAGYRIKVSGGNSAEVARAERIAAQCPQVDVVPYLTINAMTHLLAHAEAAVAVDTGFGHIAAALGIPTISIYGSTNPNYTSAIGPRSMHLAAVFPCAPCLQRTCTYRKPSLTKPACYSTIPPEKVWELLGSMAISRSKI